MSGQALSAGRDGSGPRGARAGRALPAAALTLACLASGTSARAGLPACDALRACSKDLAEEMARCCGWPARTIAQYRRMSVTDLERAPNASAMCEGTLRAIAHNALKYHEAGKLKAFPRSCREGAGD